ncbi:hypothetical protein ACIP4Y_18180 [Streptomyces sp. NPDC088810]|uniref:hypothetical protein n=1 Tax=Streptomyces sp. NPDC088810 TaxID=3365904 RepID=UPI00381100ED
MTRRTALHRLALTAASTTVIGAGVLLPTSAFAAPAATPTATVAAVDAPATADDAGARWTPTTDRPSGVSVQMPGHPQFDEDRSPDGGSRSYLLTTDHGVIGFFVYDQPGAASAQPLDLQEGLKAFLKGYNSETDSPLRSTKVTERTTPAGDQVLVADLKGADGTVGHTSFVNLGDHTIQVVTVGPGKQQKAVDRDWKQLLDSVRTADDRTTAAAAPATADEPAQAL